MYRVRRPRMRFTASALVPLRVQLPAQLPVQVPAQVPALYCLPENSGLTDRVYLAGLSADRLGLDCQA